MTERVSIFYSVSNIVTASGAPELVDVTDRVIDFTYEDKENGSDKLKLTVNNSDLAQFDDPLFEYGNKLQVTWGVGARTAEAKRMVIKKVTGGRTLKVEALNEGVVMDSLRKRRRFENVTRADVVRAVASEYGFRAPDIEDTEEVFDEIHQGNLSDAQFLRKLASLEGFQFYLDADGLHWHERRLGTAPTREYVYFSDQGEGEIIDFTIENDITRRPGRACVKSRDPITKEEIEACASNEEDTDRDVLMEVSVTNGVHVYATPGGGGIYTYDPDLQASVDPTIPQLGNESALVNVYDANTGPNQSLPEIDPDGSSYQVLMPSNVQTQADAEREAKKRYRQRSQGAVKMKLTLRGDPSFTAKTVIQVSGMGTRISGKYYVQNVSHKLSASGGYTMTAQLITDGFQSRKGASALGDDASLVSAIGELQKALIEYFQGAETGFEGGGTTLYVSGKSILKSLEGSLRLTGEAKITSLRQLIPTVTRFGTNALGAGATKVAQAAAQVVAVMQRIADALGSEQKASGKLNTELVNEDEVNPVGYTDTDGVSQTRYETQAQSRGNAAQGAVNTITNAFNNRRR